MVEAVEVVFRGVCDECLAQEPLDA
jgi:hypothetical protein